MSEKLQDLGDELDDVLTDYGTWLADAVREGRGLEAVEGLIDLCVDIRDQLNGEDE